MVTRSGVNVGCQGQGQGRGVKIRVMIGGHKVGGQGRWSRSGYRSWGQVGRGLGSRSGVKVMVKIGGQGQESRFCQGRGQGQGSRSGS